MGRVPPFWMRSMSSCASSMMVMSAPKLVSNTLSKPSRRREAAIFPSTSVPMGRPKHSPSAARTAGAVCAMTTLSGSLSASHTFSEWVLLAQRAVGQTLTHWPQPTQATVSRSMSKAQPMWVLMPRLLGPMTETPCQLRHTATQRRHRMHLLLSR